MKVIAPIVALLMLCGCAAHVAKPPAPNPVVILGNKVTPAVCECPEVTAEKARADKWKAYAEKLETQLGIPHETQQ